MKRKIFRKLVIGVEEAIAMERGAPKLSPELVKRIVLDALDIAADSYDTLVFEDRLRVIEEVKVAFLADELKIIATEETE